MILSISTEFTAEWGKANSNHRCVYFLCIWRISTFWSDASHSLMKVTELSRGEASIRWANTEQIMLILRWKSMLIFRLIPISGDDAVRSNPGHIIAILANHTTKLEQYYGGPLWVPPSNFAITEVLTSLNRQLLCHFVLEIFRLTNRNFVTCSIMNWQCNA